MKTTIFAAITIATLGAVGVATSIVIIGIPVHAQSTITRSTNGPQVCPCPDAQLGQSSGSASGHTTVQTSVGAEASSVSVSGNVNLPGVGSGGGHASGTTNPMGIPTYTSCVGSAGFKAALGCPP